MKKLNLLLLSLFLLPCVLALPQPVGFVNDFADVLTPEQEADLNAIINSLEQETTAEIAIAIVSSLEGNAKEEYAVELFEEWGIGKEETDNGLLILVAMQEREWKIEVGYGLEGAITDARAGRIARNHVVPNFQQENYYQGLKEAVTEFAGLIKEDPAIVAKYTPRIAPQYAWFVLIGYIVLAIAVIGASFPPKHKKNKTKKVVAVLGMDVVLLFLGFLIGTSAMVITFYIMMISLARLFGHAGRGSGTFFYLGGRGRGGFGGGGFGGFGGGMSGGGGAGGRW